eukprot:3937826-Rhodomonas_salina.1
MRWIVITSSSCPARTTPTPAPSGSHAQVKCRHGAACRGCLAGASVRSPRGSSPSCSRGPW